MIYLKYMVPEIANARKVIVEDTTKNHAWEEKLEEEIAYWVPNVSFLTSIADNADIAFLIIGGQAEYQFLPGLRRRVKKLLAKVPLIVIYNIKSRRIYRILRSGYTKWRFQQQVAGFMWCAIHWWRRLSRKLITRLS